MSDLADYQFELGGIPFGLLADSGITVESFDPGTPDVRTQDSVLPNRDGAVFGRDFIDGTTWAWTLSTDFSDPDGPITTGSTGVAQKAALAAVEALRTAWRDPSVRLTPGAVTFVRYALSGRTRRVYGRPRNFYPAIDNRAMTGYIPIACDFKTADALTYDDAEQSVFIQIVPNEDGGWRFPATFPVTPHPFVNRSGQGYSFGTENTWPVITITGAIIDPILAGPGWSLSLKCSLGNGETITVDTRPWAISVIRNGSQNAAGALDPRMSLRDVQIVPGNQQFTLFGSTPGDSASALITWRDAWTSL